MEMLNSELHPQAQPKIGAVPQQNYNSESDEEQYEVDGFSDEPTNPHA
jgi:hypothetical protein